MAIKERELIISRDLRGDMGPPGHRDAGTTTGKSDPREKLDANTIKVRCHHKKCDVPYVKYLCFLRKVVLRYYTAELTEQARKHRTIND